MIDLFSNPNNLCPKLYTFLIFLFNSLIFETICPQGYDGESPTYAFDNESKTVNLGLPS